MPKFFFHFSSRDQYSSDDWGLEFESAEEAYLQANATAQAMWPELLQQKIDPTCCVFEIMDADDTLLFRLPFNELVERCRSPRSPLAVRTDLTAAIGSNHARAVSAHASLRSSMSDARRSLEELNDLLRRL